MRHVVLQFALLTVICGVAWQVWGSVSQKPEPNAVAAEMEESIPDSSDDSPKQQSLRDLPAGTEFRFVAERPLFTPTRKPPEVKEVGAEPEEVVESQAVTVDFALHGVVTDEQVQLAIVKSDDGIRRLALGEEIKGWKLVSVEGSRAVFQQGNLRHELNLDFNRPAASNVKHSQTSPTTNATRP